MLTVEILAVIFTLLSVYLSAIRHSLSWPIGILGVVFYAVIFFNEKLYADLVLQVFFTIQGILGYIEWHRNREDNKTYTTKIEKLRGDEIRLYAPLVVVLYWIVSWFFHTYTNASLPYVDSLVAILSLFANYLLLKRKIENWYIWIFVDVVYIMLFFYKGLIASSILYAILLVLSIKGYLDWKKHLS